MVHKEYYDCSGCMYFDKFCEEEPCCRCILNDKAEGSKLTNCYARDTSKDKPIEDVVNHPKHYCREGGMESIDEMVLIFGKEAVMNFCLCNVWKYRYRAADKNGEEDLKKSDWYMKKYKELKTTWGGDANG